MGFAVALPQFEGPLDLLLSLIQEHKLDIFRVPISFITDRYLEYMEAARALNLDLAGEYLVMAATLAHIKSRMLLPPQEGLDATEGEVGPDPREELIRRLLEYQKYKTAGQDLGALPQLGRDLFTRRAKEKLPLATEDMALLRPKDLTAYRLIEALSNVLARRKLTIPHEVFVERLSIGDRILAIAEALFFAAERPLDLPALQDATQLEEQVIKDALEALRQKHAPGAGGTVLVELGGRWQLRTDPELAPYVRRMLQVKSMRLTRAALETLAIVAYRQPVTRPEMEDLRGVDCGAVTKALLERKLVRILGKKDEPGRPLLYGTTREFLELFNLRDLTQLPTLREFQELSEESRKIVEEEAPRSAPPVAGITD